MNLRERAELGMLKHQNHRETITRLEAKNAKLRARVAELEAALAAPTPTGESLGVPAGWQLVPVHPTPEMDDAGYYRDGRGVCLQEPAAAYRAMLAAAPKFAAKESA